MSTIFNLLCPICTDVFHNDDDIYCTSCGHVLHYRCMQDWLNRSASCPQCRSPNPSTHKLYLSFDESSVAAANINELKVALTESKQQVNGLKENLEVKEEEIRAIQEKQLVLCSEYTDSIKSLQLESEALKQNVSRLEEHKLHQSHEIERLEQELVSLQSSTDATITELRNDIMAAQSKDVPPPSIGVLPLNSSDTTITELENEIKKLRNDLDNTTVLLNEEVSKNTNLSVECMTLKLRGVKAEPDSSKVTLFEERNKVLEQKLKHITAEFEKEINKCTQLEIDNMKLQNYVDCMKTMNSAQENKSHSPYVRNMRKSTFASSTESINSVTGRNNVFFDSSSNSIIVQKFPLIQLQYPLQNTVILIANNIGIGITNDDIDKVNVVKGSSKKLSEIVSLFVRFKNKEMKIKFLTYKSRLMACSVSFLRTVQINEYVDDRAQNLFAYAKIKLSGIGYNDIFRTNNQVFAKRNMSDPRGIRILSRQQVDELLKTELTANNTLTGLMDGMDTKGTALSTMSFIS